ncbi:SdiA-regulated domain-containing protein [Anatilimnocola aggregata]|nr:SdiA-regulated domain-containing protein [Anatilimnocola aggregata]
MLPIDSLKFQFDGMFEIPGVRRDASALAVHADTGHLWTITDDKVRLVEFTNRGEFVREVKLNGIDDAEGLSYVDGNRFLIAEEKRMRITLVNVPPDVTKLKVDGPSIDIEVKSKKNKGLEGVSYDPKTDTLFTVREGKPPTVFRVYSMQDSEHRRTEEWSIDLDGFDDLSDTFFDPATGWLWLLSHESQIAAAFDPQGARVTEVILKKGHHGLLEDVEQAEGIARDKQGMLYICSEPNHIYRFRPSCQRRSLV